LINFLEKNKILLIYIPLCLYWILIFILTTLPAESLPGIGISDKINHLLAYFGLGVLLKLAIDFQSKYPVLKKKSSVYTLGIGALYGALDEIHQIFIPGRSCEFMDWVADVVGVAAGILVVILIYRIELKKY
jgi:VanZ family protein